MQKSDEMLLCDPGSKIALSAAVDMLESLLQSMALPYHKKHGPLLTSLLNGAKFWMTYTTGGAQPKTLFGEAAAKNRYIAIEKAGNGRKPADIMILAPFLHLLQPEPPVVVSEWIQAIAAASGTTKRPGSKASLGLTKPKAAKMLVAKATVSTAKGSSMKFDLFDW